MKLSIIEASSCHPPHAPSPNQTCHELDVPTTTMPPTRRFRPTTTFITVLEGIRDVWQTPRFDEPEYFLRWMKRRNFNSKEIICLLKKDFEWRKRNDVDSCLKVAWDHFPEVIHKYFAFPHLCGEDKEGRPVYLLCGAKDLTGLVNSMSRKDILFWFYWSIENVMNDLKIRSAKTNKNINEIIIISDWKDLKIRDYMYKPGIDVFLDILDLGINHYPSFINKGFVLNAPAVFSIVWSIISPFLTEDMRKKMVKIDNKVELLQYIEADQLPACYGGSVVDENGDPNCSSVICYGGIVPESYYLGGVTSVPHEEMTSANIRRSSTLQLDYKLEMGDTLKWEVISIDYDINMGLYRRTKEGYQSAQDMEVILPSERYHMQLVPECSSFTCSGKPGTYVLRFENTTWITTKTIMYKVDVVALQKQYEMEP